MQPFRHLAPPTTSTTSTTTSNTSTTSARPDGRSSPCRIGPRLETDWAHLCRQPGAIVAARSWHVTHVHFDHLDELLGLAGYGRPGDAECEHVLTRLVLTARDEPLAGRIVLQRLLPGLLARVRRRRDWYRGTTDVLEELVTAAWIVICEFDPRRHPSCLAAALIAGADHLAFGREQRRAEPVDPYDPRQLDLVIDPTPPTPADELAAVLDDARHAGVRDVELGIVHGLLDVGTPSGLATELGVTVRTVRNRRDRVASRLREIALAA
ncbi:MAG: hypothetical protein WD225_07015 [Ilumatobacteraceae bacterium]